MAAITLVLASCSSTGGARESRLGSIGSHGGGSWREGAPPDARPYRFTTRIGRRRLEDDDLYRPVHEPYVFGFDFARRIGRSPFAWETGIALAGDLDLDWSFFGSDQGHESLFFDVGLGLRSMLDLGPVQLFAGGGLALTYAELEIERAGASDLSENDLTAGAYGHVGATWNLWRGLFLGVAARLLRGTEVEFDGLPDTDADHAEATLLLGWSASGPGG